MPYSPASVRWSTPTTFSLGLFPMDEDFNVAPQRDVEGIILLLKNKGIFNKLYFKKSLHHNVFHQKSEIQKDFIHMKGTLQNFASSSHREPQGSLSAGGPQSITTKRAHPQELPTLCSFYRKS